MTKGKLFFIVVFLLSFLVIASLAYGGLVGSKHDLTLSGTISPCMFCHTPHNSRTDLKFVPIWNVKQTTPATYQMYSSSTMSNPSPASPSGVSLACLACHDGSGVLGDGQHQIDLVSHPEYMDIAIVNCSKCHDGSTNPDVNMISGILGHDGGGMIGTDLRNDHPISIPYPTPAQDPDFFPVASALSGGIKLFDTDQKVECSSCHDPHDPTNTPFLRKSNAGSALCTTCHNK